MAKTAALEEVGVGLVIRAGNLRQIKPVALRAGFTAPVSSGKTVRQDIWVKRKTSIRAVQADH